MGSRIRAPVSQTKDYKFDIGCLSVKHTTLRGKSKDYLAQNCDNVFKSDVSL